MASTQARPPRTERAAVAATAPLAAARSRRERRLEAREAWPHLIEELRIKTTTPGPHPPSTGAALAEARRAATDAIEGHKPASGRWNLHTEGGAELRRCSRVTFVVTYDVPTFRLSWIGGFGGAVTTATGRQGPRHPGTVDFRNSDGSCY